MVFNLLEGFMKERVYCQSTFSFCKVSVEEIKIMLEQLQVFKATGLDGIPEKFLRDAATIIAPTVAHIVNFSFEERNNTSRYEVG